jgi:hypothetical protein
MRCGALGNFWASEQVCVVKLVDRDAVMDKLVYTAESGAGPLGRPGPPLARRCAVKAKEEPMI